MKITLNLKHNVNKYGFLGICLFIGLMLLVSCGPQAPAGTPKSQVLVNGTVNVEAGKYYEMPFSVTSAMRDATVSGSFRASGGQTNNIEVFILDDKAFTDWTNGYQVKPSYYSGRVTEGNIEALVSAQGKYHLVISSVFSVFSSKEVSANVSLQWYER
ncbi:MAG: hypothetical protein V1767_04335 [Chloroflexota bacterium]